MVVEVALHDRLEPLSGLRNWVVRAVSELQLDFLKLGSHPLADRLTFHHKGPVPFLPANMRKAQEIECVWLSSSSLLPVWLGVEPELNPDEADLVNRAPVGRNQN